jgi:hypothetical protein
MSDINVMLSTTKFTMAAESPAGEPISPGMLGLLNMPVCLADMAMAFFGYDNVEKEELKLANLCQAMAKTVVVDSKKRTVFIGEDPIKPGTDLVDYEDSVDGECSNEFFKRWEETQEMFFQFTLNDIKGVSRFCIKGIWSKGKWAHLEIQGTPSITGVSESGI